MTVETKDWKALMKEAYRLVGMTTSKQNTPNNSNEKDLPILQHRLHLSMDRLQKEKSPQTHLKELYIKTCLNCLKDIQFALCQETFKSDRVAPSASTDQEEALLGSYDLRAIALLLGILTLWGLCPPLKMSFGMSGLERKLFPNALTDPSIQLKWVPEQAFLKDLCSTFFECVKYSHPYLTTPGNLLLQHHLIPFLAGLLYLSHESDEKERPNVEAKIYDLLSLIPKSAAFMALLALYGKSDAPAYLRSSCGHYLSHLLLQRQGVSSLVGVFLSKTMIPGKENLDSKTLEGVSRTILTLPRQSIDPKSYYRNICTQLLDIMTEEDTVKATFSAFICVQLLTKSPELGHEFVLMPILGPFRKLIWTKDLSLGIDALSLEDKDKDLDGNLIIVSEEQLQVCVLRLQFLLLETKAETQFLKTIYPRMKSSLSEIMTMVFRVADESVALEYLKALVMHPVEKTNHLVNGSAGGVAISISKAPVECELNVETFLDFLESLENKSLIADLFLSLLEFNFGMEAYENKGSSNERLLHINILLSIMSKYGSEVLQKVDQVISMVKSILSTGDSEIVPLGLTLLMALFENEEILLEEEFYLDVQEIVVYLDDLIHQSVEESLVTLATEAKTLLLSRHNIQDTEKVSKLSHQKFQEALKSLADPLLPTRAYGINILKSLILCKDEVALKNLDLITTVFLEQLQDSDSFIYLNCVKGLSALTDIYPIESLSKLVQLYQDTHQALDYRLRLGEALLQTIQRSGQMFSKHGTPILGAISRVLMDEKKEMRASAMSCLAAIAQESPLSLLPHLYQIMDYFINLLIFEKEVETRRGALYNFEALISGLDSTIFSVLPRDVLDKLQIQLELVAETDQDPLSRSHAKNAIHYMGVLIEEFLEA